MEKLNPAKITRAIIHIEGSEALREDLLNSLATRWPASLERGLTICQGPYKLSFDIRFDSREECP